MSLSIEALLGKMKEELTLAQTKNKSEQISHIYALKVMCELALQNRNIENTVIPPQEVQHAKSVNTLSQSQPLRTEDGANGESLFDF